MNDISRRHKLHQRLIIEQNKPCVKCGTYLEREVHRLDHRRGHFFNNVEVLCHPCHQATFNFSKFAVGDKVRINGRCPQYLLEGLRHNRLRTITSIYYDRKLQANIYYLGTNRMGKGDDIECYPFRSYQLRLPAGTKGGRPRLNRTVNSQDKKLDNKTRRGIEYIKEAVLTG